MKMRIIYYKVSRNPSKATLFLNTCFVEDKAVGSKLKVFVTKYVSSPAAESTLKL
jgi:hypothetical protein